MDEYNKAKNDPKPRRIGDVRLGARVIVQKCKKCMQLFESDHVLVTCPDREPLCNGLMTVELDFYFERKKGEEGKAE